MPPERILLGFNSALYCINGVLWESVAHSHGLAIISIMVAIGSVWGMRKVAAY